MTPEPTPGSTCPNVDPPINVPDDYPPGIATEFTIEGSDTIADLDICLNIDHPWPGDLYVELRHDSTATTVVLIDRPGVPATEFGCDIANVKVYLDDEAAQTVENACPVSGNRKPVGQLSAFDGESIGGTWTLIVADRAAGQSGSVTGFIAWYLPE